MRYAILIALLNIASVAAATVATREPGALPTWTFRWTYEGNNYSALSSAPTRTAALPRSWTLKSFPLH